MSGLEATQGANVTAFVAFNLGKVMLKVGSQTPAQFWSGHLIVTVDFTSHAWNACGPVAGKFMVSIGHKLECKLANFHQP